MPHRLSCFPHLPLCLCFVTLTYLAIIQKKKAQLFFLCCYLNVLSQVSGPIFNWETEHADIGRQTLVSRGLGAHLAAGDCVWLAVVVR